MADDDQSTDHDLSRSEIGSTMVDIGGDTGAAVVWTGPQLVGAEIEIRPLGAAWDGTHVAVRERMTGSGVRHAALFPSLPAGPYQLRIRPAVPGGDIVALAVEGAQVAEVTWPG